MNKKQFIEIMTELVSLKEDEDNLVKAMKKFQPDNGYFGFSRQEDLIFKTLKIAMNDSNDWIGWWLYENDCGSRGLKVKSNGKVVPSKTIRHLYKLITDKDL